MSDDALERLKKRNRPTVKNRDTSLISSQDIHLSRYPDIELSKEQNQKSTSNEDKEKQEKRNNYPLKQISEYQDIKTSEHPDITLKTKQTTLRLEENISKELSEFCKEAGFCREVFLEALIEYYQKHKDNLGEIIDEARKKAELRMEAANHKRAKSMMRKLNSSE